jgi:predicted AAA+ superfamily ATPase
VLNIVVFLNINGKIDVNSLRTFVDNCCIELKDCCIIYLVLQEYSIVHIVKNVVPVNAKEENQLD